MAQRTSDTIPTVPSSNMAQQTSDPALTALVDGVPVDAINALLLAIRVLGASTPSIAIRTDSKGMSGCSPCVTTTTTSISFSFETSQAPHPSGHPERAESVDSLEYLEHPSEAPSWSPSLQLMELPLASNSNNPAPLVAIGAPGLTPGAAQRWYAVTIGTNVGVFQGPETIRPFIEGVRGNRSVGYATRELAMAAFSNALKANKVTVVEQ